MRLLMDLQDDIMRRSQHQLRLLHAYRPTIEAAEDLALRLRSTGITVGTRGEIDDDGCTVVVFANGHPPAVEAILDAWQIKHELVDMHDIAQLTVRTYRVVLHGLDVSLVVTRHLAEPALAREAA